MLILVVGRLHFFYLLHLDEVSWRLLLRLGDRYFARSHAVLVQQPEVIVPERTAILHMVDFVLQFVRMATSLLVERLRAHEGAREFTLALSSNRQWSDQFIAAFFWSRWLLHVLQVDAVLAHDQLNHGLNFALGRLSSRMLLKLVTYLWQLLDKLLLILRLDQPYNTFSALFCPFLLFRCRWIFIIVLFTLRLLIIHTFTRGQGQSAEFVATCCGSGQCQHFPGLAMLTTAVEVICWSVVIYWLSVVQVGCGLLLLPLSLLQICASRGFYQEIEGVFAHFEDREATFRRI